MFRMAAISTLASALLLSLSFHPSESLQAGHRHRTNCSGCSAPTCSGATCAGSSFSGGTGLVWANGGPGYTCAQPVCSGPVCAGPVCSGPACSGSVCSSPVWESTSGCQSCSGRRRHHARRPLVCSEPLACSAPEWSPVGCQQALDGVTYGGLNWTDSVQAGTVTFDWDGTSVSVMPPAAVCSQPGNAVHAGELPAPSTGWSSDAYTLPAVGSTALKYLSPYQAPLPLSFPAAPPVPAAEDLVW